MTSGEAFKNVKFPNAEALGNRGESRSTQHF